MNNDFVVEVKFFHSKSMSGGSQSAEKNWRQIQSLLFLISDAAQSGKEQGSEDGSSDHKKFAEKILESVFSDEDEIGRNGHDLRSTMSDSNAGDKGRVDQINFTTVRFATLL